MRLAIRVGVATALLAAPSAPAEPVGPPTPAPAPAAAAAAANIKALPTPVATANAAPTPAATNSFKAAPTPVATVGAKAAPTPTPIPVATSTPTPTPVATSTATPAPSATATVNATSTATAAATATATIKSRTNSTVSLPPFGGRNTIPPWLKKVPSLRVVPRWPRQASSVRIFVHCPPKSNHAIIGSTAFNLKGSRRIYREVGLGLSNRGLGHRAVSISYFALPGFHKACLTCVKVTMDKRTRIRRIKVLGRDSSPIYLRRFSIWQFFDSPRVCVRRGRC